jgi:hypothetical protein
MARVWENRNAQRILRVKPKERDHLEKLGIDERITLIMILLK